MSATCAGPSCDRPAVARGLCWAHLKQRQRGEPLTPLRRRAATSTLADADRLLKLAAIAYADAPADVADAAYQELLRAVDARARVLGQAPVSKGVGEPVPP